MVKQSVARKLADRFKPGIFERLAQSKKDKNRLSKVEPTVPVLPAPTIDRRPTTTLQTYGNSVVRMGQIRTLGSETTGTVWQAWTSNVSADTTTAWKTWTSPFTITGSCTTNDCFTDDVAWAEWVMEDQLRQTHEHYRRASQLGRNTPYGRIQVVETEAIRRQREARYAAEDEQLRKEEALRKEAYDKAMKLLNSCLSQEQQDCLKKNKHFFVKAPSGRLYRIDEGTHGNLKVIHPTTRKVLETLCIQPQNVPAGDAMLMQKLMIETAEDVFRSHANITLENGKVIMGDKELLDGPKLARVIPLKAA